MKSDFDIVDHRQIIEKAYVLKGPRYAKGRLLIRSLACDVSTFEEYASAGRRQNPGQQIEDCGLAGTVGADQPDHFTGLDIDMIAGKGFDPAKAFLEFFNPDQWCLLSGHRLV